MYAPPNSRPPGQRLHQRRVRFCMCSACRHRPWQRGDHPPATVCAARPPSGAPQQQLVRSQDRFSHPTPATSSGSVRARPGRRQHIDTSPRCRSSSSGVPRSTLQSIRVAVVLLIARVTPRFNVIGYILGASSTFGQHAQHAPLDLVHRFQRHWVLVRSPSAMLAAPAILTGCRRNVLMPPPRGILPRHRVGAPHFSRLRPPSRDAIPEDDMPVADRWL